MITHAAATIVAVAAGMVTAARVSPTISAAPATAPAAIHHTSQPVVGTRTARSTRPTLVHSTCPVRLNASPHDGDVNPSGVSSAHAATPTATALEAMMALAHPPAADQASTTAPHAATTATAAHGRPAATPVNAAGVTASDSAATDMISSLRRATEIVMASVATATAASASCGTEREPPSCSAAATPTRTSTAPAIAQTDRPRSAAATSAGASADRVEASLTEGGP